MTSKEKIRDIKSVINEFYHNEKCEGRLTECARKSWLLFQEYCDDILQDLERLEALNNVWHENEPMESVDINAKHLKELYNFNVMLMQQNEKLKKTLEKACKILSWDCPCSQDLTDDLDCENRCQPDIDYAECWKKYFLKEVVHNESNNT